MTGWKALIDPELKMRFRYPDPTPQNYPLEIIRKAQQGGVRVHLLSRGSGEVYFEAARYLGMAIEQAEAVFLMGLRENPRVPHISEPARVSVNGLEGKVLTARWPDRRRQVYFLPLGPDACRIILDPESQLNWDILASLVFDLPERN